MSDDRPEKELPVSDYVGGPCPDPLRCVYWQRFPNGPWTCESNHPRVA